MNIKINQGRMIKNFITIGLRNVRKQGFTHSSISPVWPWGLRACLVITLFIIDELSYDKYNTRADRIYRVNNEIKFAENYYHITQVRLPRRMRCNKTIQRSRPPCAFGVTDPPGSAGTGNREHWENRVIWTDSSFFRIFSVNVLEGDARTALAQPARVLPSAIAWPRSIFK